MPTLEDLYPSGDYGDTPPPKQTQPTGAKRPTLDELYPLTAGGFDERHLQELEKEFGLKAPEPVKYEPLATPWDLISRAPKFVTEPARKFADWITDANNPYKPFIDLAEKVATPGMDPGKGRGFVAGGIQGAAELLSPLNVATTAAGVGAEKAGAAGLTELASLLRGVNTASAVPLVAEGGKRVLENPEDLGAWAELAGGAGGLYTGMRSGKIGGGGKPSATPAPEPLTGPTNKYNAGKIGEPVTGRAPKLGADQRGVNAPLRESVALPTLDELYPPTENVQRFGPTGTGAPWRNTNGRTGTPLREPLTLEELLAPPAPEPMRGGGLDVAPPEPPAPAFPRFPRAGEVQAGQQAMELGGSPADALARFFGLEQPRKPLGTGFSDVGQMDLGGRPVLGSELPAALPEPPIRPGGLPAVEPPAAPGTRVPTPAEALRPRMPNADTIRAAQAYINGEGPKPAGFDDLLRFFGEEPPPPAGTSVAPSDVQPRGGPPQSMEPPALPEMTLDRLKELIGGPAGVARTPELAAMRRLTGERIPPDLRQEVINILDEMEMKPYMKGETIDTQAPGFEDAGGGRNWRDSSVTGGVGFEANPEHPNLIKHYPGAEVYHEIGGSQSRGKTIEALQRMLEGGRATDLTDRAMDVAERRVAQRGPGVLEDVSGQSLLPPAADVLSTGETQPRLPGDVGAVRDVEAPQPRVAELPEQGFDLTAPPETQATQSGLFGPGAARAEAPAPGGVHPKVQELWDFLNAEHQKKNAALAAEGNPLAESGPMPETPAELEARIRNDPNPRNLWSKERKLRAMFDAEGKGEGGFAATDFTVPLAGAISGGLTGGAVDDDNRLRGMLLGALAGGLGGRALTKFIHSPAVPVANVAPHTNYVPPGARPPAFELTLPAAEKASISFLDEGTFRNNASGESSASMEALSRQSGMKARGEQFVVYDKFGNKRPLIGPDAVDYTVRPGETYGVEGPGGFRKLDDAGGRYPGKKFGDEGFIDTEALSSGAPDVMKEVGKKAEQAAYFSMLSGPSTIVKGHLGPAAVGVSRALEEGLAGRPGTGVKIIKNMFGRNSREAYMRALREGSADPTASRWGETQGVLGTPSRLMAAPDAWVTESMLDAGIPLESAKRSAFTSEQPRSEVGKFVVNTQRAMPSVIRPIAMPFARTATNILERGVERTPLLGLIFEAMQKDPTAWQDVMARQVAGLGAGTAGYAMAGEEGQMPNPYVMAGVGPYAVPMAIGAAIRKAMESRVKPGGSTDASTRALRDVTQAILSQGPIPTEGYELDRMLDPRMWPTRWIPRAVSSFADPGAYAQPGVLDPTIARIPWLNDYLLNQRRQSPAQRRNR